VRKKNDDTQLVRALALVHAIATAKRGVSLKQLADRRGWNLRALYRDVAALKHAQFPIEHVHGRYSMPQDWLPAAMVGIGRDELLALFVARSAMTGLKGTPFAKGLDRLWGKLAVKGGQVALLPSTPTGFGVRAAAIDYGAHESTIATLLDCIATQRLAKIAYRKPTGEVSERTIEPGHIHWDGGLEAMYLLSWCRYRKAVRVFAIHRIVSIEKIDEAFAPRAATSQQALAKSFRVWHRDNATLVVLRFAPAIAGEIRERQWHLSQELVAMRNGGLEVKLKVAAPEELQRWLVGFGAQVEVVEPDYLAARVQQVHADALGRQRMPAIPARSVTKKSKATARDVR